MKSAIFAERSKAIVFRAGPRRNIVAALLALTFGTITCSALADDPWSGDLTAIAASDWNRGTAAHLLERAGFGGTPEEVDALAAMSPEAAVRSLVDYQNIANDGLPEFRPSGIFPTEDFVPTSWGAVIRQAAGRAQRNGSAEALGVSVKFERGKPWLQPLVNQGYYLRFANNREITRVNEWLANRMLLTRRPLEEKLALFWHGHFATENDKVRDYRKMMAQWDMFRRHGNGNFRDLLLGICQDPAMLIYLDGRMNVKGQPNENFAREILELFSLGDGNYGEADIQEAARAFTGWGLQGNDYVKRAALHDEGEKAFLGETGNLDGEDVVNVILKQPACARFISGKLYRYFVRDQCPPELNEALAQVLRENDYEIAPLLQTLFLSKDFYSASARGTMIKSPVHLAVSTYKKLGLTQVPSAPNFQATTAGLGQQLNSPPNVAGWKHGRAWVNPSTLLERQNFVRYVLFPSEIPPADSRPMDFVGNIIGVQAYEQMREMDANGDTESFPQMMSEDSGFNRNENTSAAETYNIFRGVYNGGLKTFEMIPFEQPVPANIDTTAMVKQSGATSAAEAVAYFARRFLVVPLSEQQLSDITAYLVERNGGSSLDFAKESLEQDLRETLHLLLSAPEFQLS